MTTALATTNPEPSPLTLLAGMDQSKIEPDKLEKLLEIQAKWEDRQAEKHLAHALAEFQRDCPSIKKERKSNNGNYASLDDIMFSIRECLANNGLSVSFDTGTPAEGTITVVCHVLHAGGAKFSREVTAPVDKQMRVNDTQKMGSAISYAKRYALVAALNLIVSDHDDDGASAGSAFITREQVEELAALVEQCPRGTLESLCEWAESEGLADIPAAKFGKARATLQRKIAP